MLITNFAAGELSETLFGRIDIPQYFAGAAKLENFDVIPTGGIKRRGGMERIIELEGKGRIIPFVVNRSEGYLLYLTPDRISVYRLIDGQITGAPTIYNSGANFSLYKTADEIEEVQYAQNFDTMMLCHENYQPLEIVVVDNELSITKFSIQIDVEHIAQKEIDINDFYEDDNNYKENRWLNRDNEWPKAVTFFCGRLVFAGTKNDPQRVFVSSAKNIKKFATYKKVITETRDYITINSKIRINSNEIEMLEPGEIGKFKKNLIEYYVQTPYYSDGTMLAGIVGKTLKVTKNTKLLAMNETELETLFYWVNHYADHDAFWYGSYFYLEEQISRQITWSEYILSYSLGKFKQILYVKGGQNSSPQELLEVNLENIEQCVNDRSYLYNFVYEKIGSPKTVNTGPIQTTFYGNEFNNFIDDFYNFIRSRMRYDCIIQGASLTLYGTPENIYQQVLGNFIHNGNIYINSIIALYTKDYIIDSYPTPDCGFTFEIASDMNDAIKWLAVNKGIIIGTETAEWIIPPGVHATNVQATLNSRYGSDKIQGTAIGDATCFFQTGKKALVEYYIPQQDYNFRANNMALMSMQMLRESPAKEFDFISSPYMKLFITREDGIAAALLYERSTGTFAWSRISTEGKILSAAVLPGSDGYDELYLVVERGNLFYLEVLRENCEVFLDSFREYTGDRSAYTDKAVIHGDRIGYPYTSSVRSMPILANSKMKPNNIKNIIIRFLDSYMPKLKALPNEKVDTITNKEPFSGVYRVPFPGVWDHDVSFEFIHDKPNRCQILAINAEVN